MIEHVTRFSKVPTAVENQRNKWQKVREIRHRAKEVLESEEKGPILEGRYGIFELKDKTSPYFRDFTEFISYKLDDLIGIDLSRRSNSGLLYTSPHDGWVIPKESLELVNNKNRDIFITGQDTLINSLVKPDIWSNICRFALDMNRVPANLDKTTMDMGDVIIEKFLEENIYTKRLTNSYKNNLAQAYFFYYGQIFQTIQDKQLANPEKKILILDWHSFPPICDELTAKWMAPLNIKDNNDLPLINLGVKDFQSVSQQTAKNLKAVFEQNYQNLTVSERTKINPNYQDIVSFFPFTGAANLSILGNGSKQSGYPVEVVQIEVNDGMFLAHRPGLAWNSRTMDLESFQIVKKWFAGVESSLINNNAQ